MSFSPVWRRADLVVHDGAQAHDADVDVIFLADQPGVLQSSPAWQRGTTTADGKNVKETTGVKKRSWENPNKSLSAPDKSGNRCRL